MGFLRIHHDYQFFCLLIVLLAGILFIGFDTSQRILEADNSRYKAVKVDRENYVDILSADIGTEFSNNTYIFSYITRFLYSIFLMALIIYEEKSWKIIFLLRKICFLQSRL